MSTVTRFEHPGSPDDPEVFTLHAERGQQVEVLRGKAEFWPESKRLGTGNASGDSDMLAINVSLGCELYAAKGFWELRRGAVG